MMAGLRMFKATDPTAVRACVPGSIIIPSSTAWLVEISPEHPAYLDFLLAALRDEPVAFAELIYQNKGLPPLAREYAKVEIQRRKASHGA